MSKLKSNFTGIIAEDNSDVESISLLIKRITENNKLGFKSFTGEGCGKIKRKAKQWAMNLKEKDCTTLILVQDLDQNDIKKLENELKSKLNPCPIENFLICIPVKELEAWLLSDEDAIKNVFKLNKQPVIKGNLYDIENPKEYLRDLVIKLSNRQKRYINTIHNKQIADKISIDKIKKKNPSFNPFYNFVKDFIC